MNVPLLDLSHQHLPLHDEIANAISQVVDSNGFILGPEVSRLEKQISEYCETQFAIDDPVQAPAGQICEVGDVASSGSASCLFEGDASCQSLGEIKQVATGGSID